MFCSCLRLQTTSSHILPLISSDFWPFLITSDYLLISYYSFIPACVGGLRFKALREAWHGISSLSRFPSPCHGRFYSRALISEFAASNSSWFVSLLSPPSGPKSPPRAPPEGPRDPSKSAGPPKETPKSDQKRPTRASRRFQDHLRIENDVFVVQKASPRLGGSSIHEGRRVILET